MEDNNCNLIDQKCRKHDPLALFRLPGANQICALINGKYEEVPSIEALEGKTGFVAAPFNCSGTSPLLLIQGEKEFFPLPSIVQTSDNSPTTLPPEQETEKLEYEKKFHLFKSAIDKGEFPKIVLSRMTKIACKESFSPLQTFLKACNQYSNSFIYLYSSPLTGIWLGCTPEILISRRGEEWQTVALAGTLTSENGVLPHWNQKNRTEQAHVASYIRTILEEQARQIQETGPGTIQAGRLCHLKTTFRFQLKQGASLSGLLRKLHPTPAVCGLPKQKAISFINRNEGYDRKWYSGFTGMLDSNGDIDIYVNLRCMEITDKELKLYAGGGLVAESEMEQEWTETTNKMGTILTLL